MSDPAEIVFVPASAAGARAMVQHVSEQVQAFTVTDELRALLASRIDGRPRRVLIAFDRDEAGVDKAFRADVLAGLAEQRIAGTRWLPPVLRCPVEATDDAVALDEAA